MCSLNTTSHTGESFTLTRKTGKEAFRLNGQILPFDLLGFWQWSVSDLVSNATRGRLAEYIVANALGIAQGIRTEWDAFDLLTKTEIKVEVKSAAYLQSWHQKKESIISFRIAPSRAWSAETNEFAEEIKRQADVYVFCLLEERDRSKLDPLNLEQWKFYVLPASRLNESCPGQKNIGLENLRRLEPIECGYEGIAKAVEEVFGTAYAEKWRAEKVGVHRSRHELSFSTGDENAFSEKLTELSRSQKVL